VFKAIDTDGDGFVDEREFYQSLGRLKLDHMSRADKKVRGRGQERGGGGERGGREGLRKGEREGGKEGDRESARERERENQ
jgi:hypothetical protein